MGEKGLPMPCLPVSVDVPLRAQLYLAESTFAPQKTFLGPSQVHLDGISEYTLDSQGMIYEHKARTAAPRCSPRSNPAPPPCPILLHKLTSSFFFLRSKASTGTPIIPPSKR